MPVVLQDLIDWLVPFLAGGVASGIAFAVKWGRALIGGVRALLRADLNRIHTEYVQTGRPVNLALKDEADDIYAAYHALGGNGVGSELHRQILEAHAGRSPSGE